MATTADLFGDAISRIRSGLREAVEGLDEEQLAYRIDGRANSIGWLVWHQARVCDDHVAEVAGSEQVYTAQGWADRLGLPLEDSDTGYGHSSDEVPLVQTSAELLIGYGDAAAQRMADYVAGLTDGDLDRVVDERFDPPVTLAVRLVSVVDDCVQHLGQAALIRGLLTG